MRVLSRVLFLQIIKKNVPGMSSRRKIFLEVIFTVWRISRSESCRALPTAKGKIISTPHVIGAASLTGFLIRKAGHWIISVLLQDGAVSLGAT